MDYFYEYPLDVYSYRHRALLYSRVRQETLRSMQTLLILKILKILKILLRFSPAVMRW